MTSLLNYKNDFWSLNYSKYDDIGSLLFKAQKAPTGALLRFVNFDFPKFNLRLLSNNPWDLLTKIKTDTTSFCCSV